MDFQPSKNIQRLPDQYFAGIFKKVARVKSQAKEDFINLAIGTPDGKPPKFLLDELKRAIDYQPNNQYSDFRGLLELKQAVAVYYQDNYGVKIDPHTQVAVFDGTKSAIVKLSLALLNPGDLALIPNPYYPDYLSGLAFQGAEVDQVPLLAENDYLIDFDSIDSKSADRAKMLLMNYPNNPTGAIANREFFDQAVGFAKNHQLCIVNDMAYGSIIFDGKEPVSLLQSPGGSDYGVELFSLSKIYNISGWRIGFAVGNRSVIQALNTVQDHFAAGLYGALQQAAAKMLVSDQTFVKDLTHTYQVRRDAFINVLQGNQIPYKKPEGGIFVWIKTPPNVDSQSFAKDLLERKYLAVAPGNGFGEWGEGYIRVGLITEPAKLSQAAGRISQLYKEFEEGRKVR